MQSQSLPLDNNGQILANNSVNVTKVNSFVPEKNNHSQNSQHRFASGNGPANSCQTHSKVYTQEVTQRNFQQPKAEQINIKGGGGPIDRLGGCTTERSHFS